MRSTTGSVFFAKCFQRFAPGLARVLLTALLPLCSPAWSQTGAPVSDDFNGTSLNTALWTASTPAGGTVSVSNGHLNLAVPGGSNHDAFVGGDNSVRILQSIANGDFEVAAKFDSGLSKAYEGEGILVQQDSGTYLRLEFTFGSSTALSCALVSAGTQKNLVQATVSNPNPSLYLQVHRSGNNWTVSYSNDGTSYTALQSFSQSLTVSAIGPYAWNYNSTASSAPALTSLVDFFHNLTATSPGTVATPSISPATGTTFSTSLSVSISDTTSGATIYYSTDGSTPTTGSPVYGGPFVITESTTVKAFATAANENPSSIASASYVGPNSQTGPPVSDDFNGTSLNTALWTASTPAGGTVSVSNGHLNLAVPGGSNHDAFVGGDNSVRILQSIANGDFEVAAKFDSGLSKAYQGEGILVQQDSGTYLRLEFSFGSSTSVFCSLVSAGKQQTLAQATVSNPNPSLYLQVQRSGNNWTVSYSNDGTSYTPLQTFSQSLNVSAIGPYAWNYNSTASNAPALTALVDFFHNMTGGGGGGGTNPPVISGTGASPSGTSASITWTTDQPATSQVNYGLTSKYGSTATNSVLVTSHNQPLSNLSCNSQYHFQVASANAGGQTSTSGDNTFTTGACSAGPGPVSDNFDSSTLNNQLWTFANPAGDGVLSMNGTAVTLNLPGGVSHDPWTSGNKAISLLQAIGNINFQVGVRFQSDVEIGNQDEGIMVVQDASHFLRFDVLSDGTSVRIFSAGIQGSNSTVFGNTVINVTQAPIILQLSRQSNNWVAKWSTDGVNFNTAFSFSYTMTVASIGPYAGNSNNTASNTPAFTAIVDYFFNTASPASNRDGPPPFQAITVDPNPPSALVEKTFADIQGTGHLDVVAGFEAPSSGGIYWYQYPASGKLTDTWLKHTIVNNGKAYEDMVPLDLNKDGAVDIVASYSANGGNSIYWFENPRGHGGNPATDAWAMHLIGTGAGENNLIIADIDGDGKPDLATGTFIYFQNNADSWTRVQYNNAFRGIATLDIGSGKGSINLVSTAASTYDVAWFENPREQGGNARTGKWIEHNIGAGYPCNNTDCPGGDFYVSNYGSGDFDGDGRMDVVSGQSEGPFGTPPPPGGLIWFEAPSDRRNGTWTRHTIDSKFVDTHNVRVSDMDHNGTLDIVTAEQDQSIFRRVAVFYNDGSGNFTEHVISNAAGHQDGLGDVNDDGSIDILNSAHGYPGFSGNVALIHPIQIFLNPDK